MLKIFIENRIKTVVISLLFLILHATDVSAQGCSSPYGASQTVCSYGTYSLNATTMSSGITQHRWYQTPTGGTPEPNITYTHPAPDPNILVSTLQTYFSGSKTYYVAAVCNGTESARTAVTLTITTGSIAITPSGSPTLACVGTFTLTASGGTNYEWRYNTTTGSPFSTSTVIFPDQSGMYYLTGTGSCGVQTQGIPVTAFQPPVAPIVSNTVIRYNTSTTLVASGATGSEGYKWYDANNVQIGTGASYVTGALTQNKTYYVSKFAACEGPKATVFVRVNLIPVAEITPTEYTIGLPKTSFVLYGNGYDADGDALTYLWTRTSGPASVTLSGASTSMLTLTNIAAGTYTFELKITDVVGDFSTDVVTVTASTIADNYTYAREDIILKRGVKNTTQIPPLTQSEKAVTKTYVNDIGAPIQIVSMQSSPAGSDQVSATTSDELGRQITSYPAIAYNTTDGLYKSDVLKGAGGTYTGSKHETFFNGSTANVAGDTKPFATVVIEKSPLGRTLEQGGYGIEWQPNPTTPSLGKTNKFSYTSNANDEVLQLGVQNSGLNAELTIASFYYPAGALTVQVSTDPHGSQIKEYTDGNGRQVLKKVQVSDTEWRESYYVYDEKGSLIFSVSPELSVLLRANYPVTGISFPGTLLTQPNSAIYAPLASSAKWMYLPDITVTIMAGYTATPGFELTPWGNTIGSVTVVTPALVSAYTMQNSFDTQGRLIAKRQAGSDWEYIIYNAKNYVVLTQSPHLRSTNQWKFYKYDASGREVLVGIVALAESVEELRTTAKNAAITFETYLNTNVNSVHGYSNNAFPSVDNASCLQVAYYDNYQYKTLIGNSSYDYVASELDSLPATPSAISKTLNTGNKLRSLSDANTWVWEAIYYDDNQRVAQQVRGNFKGGIDRMSGAYNFSGWLLSIRLNHNLATVSIRKRFEYDHRGRLLRTYHKLNSQPEILFQKFVYNELGQLVDKSIHSEDQGTTWLQSEDVAYNMLGQIGQINNLTGNAGENDYIGFDFAYQNTVPSGNTPRYDGNISAIRWSNDLSAKPRAYNYTYDRAGQLKASQYKKNVAPAWIDVDNYSENNLVYDLNGNIKSVTRYQNSSSSPIDQLNYTYASGNQLLKIDDSGTSAGFKNGTNVDDDYSYDLSGNLVADKNKDIQLIEYNILNRPKRVVFVNGTSVEYTYDGVGTRISVKRLNAASQVLSTTEYVSGLVYIDGVLQIISTEEGRILPPAYTNLITNREAGSTSGFTALPNATDVTLTAVYQASVNTTMETYVKAVCNTGAGTPGIFPIGNTFTVKPGESYSFKVLGYQSVGTSAKLYVWANGDLIWPGVALPQGMANENWVSTPTFTIPAGVTQLKVGVKWQTPANGNTFFINRVALYKMDWEYQYLLSDQVGSPRVVLSTSPSTQTYTATFEDRNKTVETSLFLNIDYTKMGVAPSAASATPGGTEFIKMNSSYRIGPAKSLKVYPGDKIDASVSAYYDAVASTGKTPFATMASALIAVMTGGTVPPIDAGITAAYTNAANGVAGFGLSAYQGASSPSAFLNYILFDENYVPLEAKSIPVPGSAGSRSQISFSGSSSLIQVKEVGLLFVYLSYDNEVANQASNWVYFDDFTISHAESAVVQVNDYYPYGLTSYSWIREGEYENRFLYQNKEYDTLTGWADFHARQYDPSTGRWFANDPMGQFASPYLAMGNNPVSMYDANGMWTGWDDVVVAAVGFVYGYVSYGIMNDDWGGRAVGNGLLNAAMFELGYLSMGGGAAGIEAAGAGASAEAASMTAAETYLVTKGASMILSRVVPSVPIYEDEHVSLEVTPTFSMDGIGVGLNGSVSFDNYTISASASYSELFKGGFETRTGGGISYYNPHDKIGGSVGIMHFGGTDPQNNWIVGFKRKKFSFTMTNDVYVGGDKYRTAAAEIGYSDYRFGFNLYSTEPDPEQIDCDYESRIWKKNKREKGSYAVGSRVYSNLYFGYQHNGVTYRAGIDAPFVQDFFQNGIHKYIVHSPYFKTDYGTKPKLHYFQSTTDPLTLY